jgi:hypothetical protein
LNNTLTGSGPGAAVHVVGDSGGDPEDFWVGSENNLIAENSDGGVLAEDADWHSRNDTMADNDAFAYAYTGTVTTTLRIVNGIAWDHTADFSDLSPSVTPVFTATYSILEHGTLGEGSNLTLDPLFVGGGDYQLQSTSPARDSANTAAAPGNDIQKNPRPFGVEADRGAYEFTILKVYLPLISK